MHGTCSTAKADCISDLRFSSPLSLRANSMDGRELCVVTASGGKTSKQSLCSTIFCPIKFQIQYQLLGTADSCDSIVAEIISRHWRRHLEDLGKYKGGDKKFWLPGRSIQLHFQYSFSQLYPLLFARVKTDPCFARKLAKQCPEWDGNRGGVDSHICEQSANQAPSLGGHWVGTSSKDK